MDFIADWKSQVALLSIVVGTVGNWDYFVAIRRHVIRPHLFSWFIWGIITVIAAAAQAIKGAGPGNWATIYTAGVCFVFAAMALKYGERNITRSDWIALILAFLAIPLWLITGDPVWSVIWACVIDALGFYPTMRKSWHKPNEENIRPYFLANIKFLLGLVALDSYNLTTMLYPSFCVFINFVFIGMLNLRRQQLNKAVA